MSALKVGTDAGNGSSPGLYYKEPPAAKVDVSSEASLQKWGEMFGLSRKELLAAVDSFGPDVRHIRRGLLQQKSEDEAA